MTRKTSLASPGVSIPAFDWKHPEYGEVYRRRMAMLDWIRAHPQELPVLKAYYKLNPGDFINDWGMTFEPRNVELGRPAYIPFLLFPRQREWIDFVLRKWREGRPGLCEKSRDMGVSWLGMSLACTMCIFYDGFAVGVGSRKTEYVDKIGTMKPLLPKARIFMENLPEEFRAGWVAWRDAPYMRLTFPDTGSFIGGEGGDDLGRGDRTAFYLVDEYAHFDRPLLTEASLSQTTNCRIDMSSVRGMNNPFAQKRWGGKIEVFIFDWHDDPRKDQAWYDQQCHDLDPVVVAQEIDRDYQASVHGVVIPGPWVRSAIGALERLGIAPTGARDMALDIADEGLDKNAIVGRTGNEIDHLEEWSGKGSDTFLTVEHAFETCDEQGYGSFRYDADGIGASCRGDARVVNLKRKAGGAKPIRAEGFRGSEAVFDPDGIVEGTIGLEGDKGRTNQDYFANRKAQGWWSLRRAFQKTHRWIEGGVPCDPNEIISLKKDIPLLQKLVAELSQPTYSTNLVGKIVINKKPDGMPSPNLADGAMMRYAPNQLPPLNVTTEIIAQITRAGLAGRRRR